MYAVPVYVHDVTRSSVSESIHLCHICTCIQRYRCNATVATRLLQCCRNRHECTQPAHTRACTAVSMYMTVHAYCIKQHVRQAATRFERSPRKRDHCVLTLLPAYTSCYAACAYAVHIAGLHYQLLQSSSCATLRALATLLRNVLLCAVILVLLPKPSSLYSSSSLSIALILAAPAVCPLRAPGSATVDRFCFGGRLHVCYHMIRSIISEFDANTTMDLALHNCHAVKHGANASMVNMTLTPSRTCQRQL